MSEELENLKNEIDDSESISKKDKNEMRSALKDLEISQSELKELLAKTKISKLDNFLSSAFIYLFIFFGIVLLYFSCREFIRISG